MRSFIKFIKTKIFRHKIRKTIKDLNSKDNEVRKRAALKFKEMGKLASVVLPELITALHDKDEQVRWTIVWTLGKIGMPDIKPVVPQLINLLKDYHYNVRWAAAIVLGKCGKEAKEAVYELEIAKGDGDKAVRRAAEWAINIINQETKK